MTNGRAALTSAVVTEDGEGRQVIRDFHQLRWTAGLAWGPLASLQIRCEESMKEVLAGFPADRQAARSVGSGMKAPLY